MNIYKCLNVVYPPSSDQERSAASLEDANRTGKMMPPEKETDTPFCSTLSRTKNVGGKRVKSRDGV